MSDLPEGKPITQRDLIEFMVEVRMGMAAFSASMERFTISLDEHTDRVNADTDEVRAGLTKRIQGLEEKVEKLTIWKTTQAAWLAGALAVIGTIWIVISKLSDRLFK